MCSLSWNTSSMTKRRRWGGLADLWIFLLAASQLVRLVVATRQLVDLTAPTNGQLLAIPGEQDELAKWDLNHWPGRLVAAPLNLSFSEDGEGSESPRARLLSEGNLPGLTNAGKAIKTVVFASMLDGTCKSDDWRGDLPRHFMRYLPNAEGFLVYARHPDRHDCSTCGSDGTKGHAECQSYLAGSHRKADLLVVIGTGLSATCNKRDEQKGRSKCDRGSPHHYTSLDHVFHSRYATKKTVAVHIPVRKLAPLNRNTVFRFQYVIHDDEFLKPLAQQSINEMRHYCARTPKAEKLMYVGRYTEGKGQLSFLETVDPAAVAGYELEFFGGDYHDNELPAMLRKVAKRRNISVTVHAEVSHQKLLHSYCQSAGLIHYAKGDNNPRVAYEALYAGTPLFVTRNANLPERIYRQNFVESLEWGSEEFSAKFQGFMNMIKSPKTHEEVHAWVDRYLVPDKVYRNLCTSVGVCKGAKKQSNMQRKAVQHANKLSSLTSKNTTSHTIQAQPGLSEKLGKGAVAIAESTAHNVTAPEMSRGNDGQLSNGLVQEDSRAFDFAVQNMIDGAAEATPTHEADPSSAAGDVALSAATVQTR